MFKLDKAKKLKAVLPGKNGCSLMIEPTDFIFFFYLFYVFFF